MTDIDGDIARRQINEYEDHSGGAYGADTEWDIIGRQYGLTKFNHYRDEGNQSLSKRLRASGVKAKVLTKEQIEDKNYIHMKLRMYLIYRATSYQTPVLAYEYNLNSESNLKRKQKYFL